jgi:Tfp pilus assembly protein PilN
MGSLFFLPMLMMLAVYLPLIVLTFYFIYYLVNKSHKLQRERNDLLRELISKLGNN